MSRNVPIADPMPEPMPATTMTLSVDRIRCCGYGLCVAECPEVFELDEEGLARVKLAVVPAELREAAERGALSCPEEAVTITGSGSEQHGEGQASGPRP